MIEPIRSGVLPDDGIVDMFQVMANRTSGRRSRSDVTVFKSGGGGHEDLAVALSLFQMAGGKLSVGPAPVGRN